MKNFTYANKEYIYITPQGSWKSKTNLKMKHFILKKNSSFFMQYYSLNYQN